MGSKKKAREERKRLKKHRRNLKTLIVSGLTGLIVVGACIFLVYNPIGKTAPDFSITSVNGKSIHLSDLKGKKVVLIFYYSNG